MSQELIATFETVSDKFYHAFSVFNKEQVNMVPYESSWTPAQVVVHILKSQVKFPQLLGGETKEAGRDPEANKEALKKIFLDFSTKLKSPDFILPTTEPQDKEQLLNTIKERKDAIITAMRSNDLSRICIGYELPGFGQLTGMEWIGFADFHVQRHTYQLEKIYEIIKNTMKHDE